MNNFIFNIIQYVPHIIHNAIFKLILALARATPRYHVYRIKKRHKKRRLLRDDFRITSAFKFIEL